jgi:hypothetical protein
MRFKRVRKEVLCAFSEGSRLAEVMVDEEPDIVTAAAEDDDDAAAAIVSDES